MTDEVKRIVIELQRPKGSFPGRVEIGYYVVVEGNVVLTDEHGKPLSGVDKRYVGPNGDPHLIACVMLRQRSRAIAKSRSFNRPIQYGRSWRGV
jgi:hypothetical protein